jgi:hypothetical protein
MAGMMDEFAASFGGGNQEDESEEDVVDQVVQELDDDEIDDELREAEKRLSKAAYYKQIALNGVIEDDGSPEASEINAESRLWARQRMLVLLKGEPVIAAPVVAESQFNDKEVFALKKVAEKILLSMGEKPVDPVVKKVQTTPVKPTVPTVRKIQTTVKKPGGSTPPKKPPTQAPPAASAAAKPKKPLKPKKDADGEVDYEAIPSGTVFTDTDGQLYRFLDNPNFNPENPRSKPRTKMKVTTQVKTPGSIPMPSPSQMSGITAAQSMEAVNIGTSASASSPFGADKDASPNLFIAAAAGALIKE